MHAYDVSDAVEHSIPEAVVMHNFRFWLRENKAHNRNVKDGRVWTFTTAEALSEVLPELSVHQIRHILKKLSEKGILIKGNYNKVGYDRTLWYSLDEEEFETDVASGDEESPKLNSENTENDLADLRNGIGRNATPIPDSKPNSKPNANTHTNAREGCDIWRDSDDEIDRKVGGYSDKWKTVFFVDAWNKIYKDYMKVELKPTDKKHKQVMKKLAIYKPSMIIMSLKNRANDQWLKDEGIMGEWNKFWEFGDKVEEYINRDYTKKTEKKANKPDYGYNMPWEMY